MLDNGSLAGNMASGERGREVEGSGKEKHRPGRGGRHEHQPESTVHVSRRCVPRMCATDVCHETRRV